MSYSLVIYGVCRNKFLGKISKSLTILLAIEGVLGALVIQLLYVIAKFIMLANIHSLPNVSYCMLMLVVVIGTKILGEVSIATMLGITAERYAAVIHPHQYASHKRSFPKITNIFIGNFSDPLYPYRHLGLVQKQFQNPNSFINFCAYVFTVYACGKIYFKLRHLDKIRRDNNNHSAAFVTRNSKSLKSSLVVGSYMVCYLPLVIIRGLNLHGSRIHRRRVVHSTLVHYIGFLLFFCERTCIQLVHAKIEIKTYVKSQLLQSMCA